MRILQLYPFIDDERVLKVDGCLVAVDCLNESAKFQSILPYEIHLSKLIVIDSHQRVTRSIVGNCIASFRSMVLGAHMIQTDQTAVNENGFTTEIYACSDSTVALAWIISALVDFHHS